MTGGPLRAGEPVGPAFCPPLEVTPLAPLPAIVLPAVEGDPLNLPGEPRQVTGPRCETFSPRGYVCLTHAQPLANDYQLQSHVESSPATEQHIVARVCAYHGPEVL